MGEIASSKTGAANSAPHENPLVPNRKMKRMYEGIVEARMLEDLLRRLHKKSRPSPAHGQEACRISVLIDLDPEDLTSDGPHRIEAALIRGARLDRIARYAAALASGKKKNIAAANLHLPGILPVVEDASDRLQLALGAALTLKRLKLPRIVVFFAIARALKHPEWRKALRFAAQETLPILFVALPEPGGKPSGLCALAVSAGVPGIPVDAADAVALYRVTQESLGRLRGGDGAVLMECLSFVPANSKHKQPADPVAAMQQTLLNRRICDQAWLDTVAATFEKRLKTL